MDRKYKRNPKMSTFLPSFLEGLTSVGLLYTTKFTPVKYVDYFGCDSNYYGPDLETVGEDMWRAVEIYRDDTQEEETTKATT